MNNNYLGVYDSGVGGLTVVKAIKEALPEESIVYLADSKNMPYGNKSEEEILSFSISNIDNLKKYDIKAVVIACNTSDSLAKDKLLKLYDLPIIGVIKPAVKKAVSLSKNKTIGILATQATINSKAYEKQINKLDQDIKCIPVACPALVPLIEQGHFYDEDMKKALKEYLEPIIKEKADTIILGCTHYDVLSDTIRTINPKINIVSSSRCVVEDLEELLEEKNMKSERKEKTDIYLATGDTNFGEIASKIIYNISIEKI